MNYLNLLIEGIITEEVNITKITDAIHKRKPVRMSYEADEEPNGRGERVVYPVAYGVSKAGNMVLRAFQPYGDTKTKVPHWKLFRIDKIKDWKILWKRSSFDEPPGQYQVDGKYNPNGDKTMAQVYLSVNFQNSRDFKSGIKGHGLMQYNQKREKEKLNNDPLYKLRRNIENADNDNKIKQRVNNNPSKAAKEYVTNNSYIEDMNKVDNMPNDTPQTNGFVRKGDVEKQNTSKVETSPVNYDNNTPMYKNSSDDDNNLEDKNKNFYERSTAN